MSVSSFMIPVKDIVKCTEWDPIVNVIESVLDRKISAVIVVDADDKPVGIVTKTDLVLAYKQAICLHQRVGVIMARALHNVRDTDGRAEAADVFVRYGTHHAVVTDADGHVVGLVSAWDVAAECSREKENLDNKVGALTVADVH